MNGAQRSIIMERIDYLENAIKSEETKVLLSEEDIRNKVEYIASLKREFTALWEDL